MQALEGIRVLDLGTFIAGPFCATMLGEFGADVIKVERPGVGDHLRRFGTETECGDTLVWLSEGRNKRSITLDLSSERGRDVLRRLITTADVVIENFRPGVMERWGLGYDALKELNPGVVFVRVSAYGQTGPASDLPGFARIAHAFSGLAYLAGEPGRPPVVPGSTSLADYASGMYAAFGVMLALWARQRTGEGQCVDLALYESIFRLLDELAPAFQKFGFVRERMGADTVNVTPHSHYQTEDGHWVAIACSHDDMFVRLAGAMGRPELADPARYGPKQARLADRGEVNRIVGEWVASLPRDTVLERCRQAEVPAGPLYSIAEIFDDPQYLHRGNITSQDSRVGELAVPDALPRMSGTPAQIRWLGPALGEHTDEVLGELLGLDGDELGKLRADGVI